MKGSYTKIAAFAKTTGMDTADALGLADRAMVAIADSAAFYDRTLEETTESLQSFLKGNYENDAALGLSCTETTRNAAANQLYGKSFKDLSEQQKQLTLLQMVEDANELSGAMGQSARETDTWTNQTGNLKQAWQDLKANLGTTVLSTVVDVVKSLSEEYVFAVFDAISAFINNAINKIKEIITTVLNAIKAVWDTVWTAIKDFLMPIINSIKDFISTAFNAIKNVITNIINSVKNTVTTVFNAIKNAISVPLNAAKSTVSNVFDAIRDKIDSVISKAKDIVQKGLDAIKGFFDKLKLKFPDLKLPHFKVDGEFSLNPPKVPKFAIDWYDKAMDDGMILNKPTIFGVNSKGQPMGGGETGSETVVGTQSLMNMINNAVGQSNNGLYDVLDKILTVLKNIDNSMYDKIVAALQALGIEFDERELARLVKKYA